MKTRNSVLVAVICSLMLLVLALSIVTGGVGPAMAAPEAAPTPVSITRPGGDGSFVTFDLFNTRVITSDTTSACVDIGKYSIADVQYTIDQGTTNTTTLTTKFSVDGGTLVSGVNVVASNAADATNMQQVQLFGRYICLLADVSNSNSVTVTARLSQSEVALGEFSLRGLNSPNAGKWGSRNE